MGDNQGGGEKLRAMEGSKGEATENLLGKNGKGAEMSSWSNARADARSKWKVMRESSQSSFSELMETTASTAKSGAQAVCALRGSNRLWALVSAGVVGFVYLFAVSAVITPMENDVHLSWHVSTNSYLTNPNYEDDEGVFPMKEELGKFPESTFNPLVPRTPLIGFNPSSKYDPRKVTFFRQTRWPIRVALYNGAGASTRSWRNIRRILRCASNSINVTLVKKVSPSTLNRKLFDVVVFPGGGAGRVFDWHNSHHASLKTAVRNFLHSGGGYMGFCAGAYLAKGAFHISAFKPASSMLGVGWFSGVETSPWYLKQNLFPINNSTLNEDKLFYANGPIFLDAEIGKLPKYTKNPQVILRIEHRGRVHIDHGDRMHKPHDIRRKYSGDPVLTYNEYSRGKVLVSTAHPESNVNSGLRSYQIRPTKCNSNWGNTVVNMVLLAANRTKFHSELHGEANFNPDRSEYLPIQKDEDEIDPQKQNEPDPEDFDKLDPATIDIPADADSVDDDEESSSEIAEVPSEISDEGSDPVPESSDGN